uniref:NADH-ubiquinone oxidoreductase chain 3 n=1 Tax=Chonosia crassipennis TaxID=1986890 RepID=A0A3S7MGL9_9HEMI|nr:NADH dehydrogenase subunit 3 [Chonosia crassipennis]
MYMILIFSVTLLSLLLLFWLILYIISNKTILDREKLSPFECGFDPMSSPRVPFSSHFFLIAVIFLIFDVELVVIMPLIICMMSMNLLMMYMIVITLLFILIFGLFHEWKNKMLDWM